MKTEMILGAGGILFDDYCRILVIIESESDLRYGKVAGQISIPMGKLDGQAPQEALEREFLEESGVLVRALRPLDIYPIPGDPGALVYIWIVERYGNTTVLGGAGTLNPRWMPIEELLTMPDEAVRPPTKAAVKLALRTLQRV